MNTYTIKELESAIPSKYNCMVHRRTKCENLVEAHLTIENADGVDMKMSMITQYSKENIAEAVVLMASALGIDSSNESDLVLEHIEEAE